MSMKDKIAKAGKKLAALNPIGEELKTLIDARRWWVQGTKYSNEDCDILQALLSAIYRLENN